MKKGHGGKKSASRWIVLKNNVRKYIHKRGHHGEQITAMRKDARVKKWEKRRNEGGGSNDERMKRVKARMDQMITWSRKKWDDKEMIEWGKRK